MDVIAMTIDHGERRSELFRVLNFACPFGVSVQRLPVGDHNVDGLFCSSGNRCRNVWDPSGSVGLSTEAMSDRCLRRFKHGCESEQNG